ncbi:hypothetical protein GOC13_24490 [Sinorhizobium meliloti]|nr:hypothetical protein [Sinorhizobium meliloti]
MSLKTKILCALGMHRFIQMPVKCFTLPNSRNIIVCESRCTICGASGDLR